MSHQDKENSVRYCSIADEEPGAGGQANYKQAVAENVRGGAKTKDKGLLRDMNELTPWPTRYLPIARAIVSKKFGRAPCHPSVQPCA